MAYQSFLYRIKLNAERSVTFTSFQEASDWYVRELLAGREGMQMSVISDSGWLPINDVRVCSWCKKPIGEADHTDCQIHEDEAFKDFVDYVRAQ